MSGTQPVQVKNVKKGQRVRLGLVTPPIDVEYNQRVPGHPTHFRIEGTSSDGVCHSILINGNTKVQLLEAATR